MYFIELMAKRRIFAKAVSTPKEAKIGCGISAEIPLSVINLAQSIIKSVGFSSFYGIFLIEKRGLRITTTKI